MIEIEISWLITFALGVVSVGLGCDSYLQRRRARTLEQYQDAHLARSIRQLTLLLGLVSELEDSPYSGAISTTLAGLMADARLEGQMRSGTDGPKLVSDAVSNADKFLLERLNRTGGDGNEELCTVETAPPTPVEEHPQEMQDTGIVPSAGEHEA